MNDNGVLLVPHCCLFRVLGFGLGPLGVLCVWAWPLDFFGMSRQVVYFIQPVVGFSFSLPHIMLKLMVENCWGAIETITSVGMKIKHRIFFRGQKWR